MRRAPDEAVHRHFQGEVFALDQATHRAVNVHEKATDFLLVNFLIFSFFFFACCNRIMPYCQRYWVD